MMLKIAALLLLVGAVFGQYEAVDESLSLYPNEDFIKTSILPGGVPSTAKDDLQMMQYNPRELPELSSGVIGTVVYNESIFLSGLYRTASAQGSNFFTRVRIPNYAMFRINKTDEVFGAPLKRSFYFNISKALWEEAIDTPTYYIRSIMGIHAHYSRTFFHAIHVTKKETAITQSLPTFTLSTYHADLLTDKKFAEDLQVNGKNTQKLTNQDGADGYRIFFPVMGAADGSDSEIVVISNGPQAGKTEPNTNIQLTFKAGQTVQESLFLQTVAPKKDLQSAFEEYKKVQASLTDIRGLMDMHTKAWDNRFKAGTIEVQGANNENYAKMRRLIKSSLYQVYSQFPFTDRYGANLPIGSSQVEDPQFNGVSACGLGRAGNSTKSARIDFAGHVTPDQEAFLFLPLAILQPDLARQILFYRTRQLQSNNPPVPFEAARSGSPVDAVWCTHCQQQAFYPTGLLGLAVRHFHAITRDQTWVDLSQRGGLEILEKIANFFNQKIQRNATRAGDFYAILGACGPDERHERQTNNLATNALAALSIHYWSYLRCLSGKTRDAAHDTLLDHAKRLAFPFDAIKGENEQFEGYDRNPDKAISQVDAMLAYFPAAWNMSGRWLEQSNAQRLYNDIQKYNREFSSTSNVPTNIPGPSLGIKAITHMQVGTNGELDKGRIAFEELWKQYASSPFFVWRNTTDTHDLSAAGHIGTAAAFLETLIFGFGGLRVHANRLDILRPSIPNDVTSIKFKGLHYYGGEFDYEVTSDKRIRLSAVGGSAFKTQMALYDRTNRRHEIFSGSLEQQIPAQPSNVKSLETTTTAAVFSLVPVESATSKCVLEDQNYRTHNPYFYSAANTPRLNSVCLFAILTMAIWNIFAN